MNKEETNVSRSFCVGNTFVKWNRKYKWLTIEHDWKGCTLEHKWTWGFGQPIKYRRTWLPF